MTKRNEIVAIESRRVTHYNFNTRRPAETSTSYQLGRATSVGRDGIVKSVRLCGFPYDPTSKFQSHLVRHMHASKVLTISPEHQSAAEKLMAHSIIEWATAQDLRSAILAGA
jgi:hypothetical protein